MQVVSSFASSEHLDVRYWGPCIQQRCLLNIAITYLGYPGGESRCHEKIEEADINSASSCLQEIRLSKDLMDSLDPRSVVHLIRTEGDWLFRKKKFPEAVDKFNEAKCLAQENGFKTDVKYCDDRLKVVEPLTITLCTPARSADSDYEADISNVESSDNDGAESTSEIYLGDEKVFAAMCSLSMHLPAEESDG